MKLAGDLRIVPLAVVAGVLLVAAFSCARGERAVSSTPRPIHANSEAKQRWKSQEEVVVNILQGRPFNEKEFVAAVDFFQQTTGLPSHDSGTYIGRIPNEQLQKDLEGWRDWYRQNEAFLYWNPATGRIEVDEKEKVRRQQSGSPS
jgi:hypothetical protein